MTSLWDIITWCCKTIKYSIQQSPGYITGYTNRTYVIDIGQSMCFMEQDWLKKDSINDGRKKVLHVGVVNAGFYD